MREYRRREPERQRISLIRDAEGRLRPNSEASIGDIWAAQQRIRLAEAIAADKKRAAHTGHRRKRLRDAWELFKEHLKPASPDPITPMQPSLGTRGTSQRTPATPKTIEIKISLPSELKLPKVGLIKRLRHMVGKISTGAGRGLPKKAAISIGAILLVCTGVYGYHIVRGHQKSALKSTPIARSETLGAVDAGPPPYRTVLPEGKTIEQLGGWGRVSPADRDPVYAYVDHVGTVQINVSEQPVPQSFKEDIAGSTAKLAEQFSANQKLTFDDITAYVGTSAKGPQSLIVVKDSVLILIKSSQKLTDEQWRVYISSLR